MYRFQRIRTNKELINHIIDKLIEIGYKEIPNCTGGDEDFLTIDTLRKEYIWCENGFAPFCSDDSMHKYEFHDKPDAINLKMMENSRY
jgi:hypothetical protein